MEINKSLITTTEGSANTTDDGEQRMFVENVVDFLKDRDKGEEEEIEELINVLTAVDNCTVIWEVGLAFTALGLIIITSTWILFPKWRHYKNYLSWNQCFSTIVMSWFQAAVFIWVLPSFFENLEDTDSEKRTMDILVGIADYFELASMCWTVASAVLCYAQVVLVFDRNCSHKYTKVTLLCWGVPLILKGIIVVIDMFVDTEDDPEINYEIVPLVPVIIMALINIYCYVRVIVCIIKRKHDQRRKLREAIRTITTGLFLLFIFMFTFVMRFMDLMIKANDFNGLIIYIYIMTVLCSIHGGVLAFAFVFAIRSTRNMWVERFYKKKRAGYSTDTTGTTGTIDAGSHLCRSDV